MACSSDSGTIHIFCMKLTKEEENALKETEQKNIQQQNQNSDQKNPKSKMSFLKGLVPYFDSEWSFSQFRVVDNKTKVCFGTEPNTIIVISYEGKYYKASFDPVNGGECTKDFEDKILKDE